VVKTLKEFAARENASVVEDVEALWKLLLE